MPRSLKWSFPTRHLHQNFVVTVIVMDFSNHWLQRWCDKSIQTTAPISRWSWNDTW